KTRTYAPVVNSRLEKRLKIQRLPHADAAGGTTGHPHEHQRSTRQCQNLGKPVHHSGNVSAPVREAFRTVNTMMQKSPNSFSGCSAQAIAGACTFYASSQ